MVISKSEIHLKEFTKFFSCGVRILDWQDPVLAVMRREQTTCMPLDQLKILENEDIEKQRLQVSTRLMRTVRDLKTFGVHS